ncbi:MAG: clan AA aspartic protease [Chitinophagaceae bacterium]|nr:clan AA aspartic protease [Chitinophagaceae bacterium]
MGLVYADIEISNSFEKEAARRGLLDKDAVKTMNFHMMVDTGVMMPAINETIQQVFNFPFMERKRAVLADGRMIECDVVGPVDYRWQNRTSSCKALVLPEGCEPLFGAIPMEEMDIYVHPLSGRLMGNHPDYPIMMLK